MISITFLIILSSWPRLSSKFSRSKLWPQVPCGESYLKLFQGRLALEGLRKVNWWNQELFHFIHFGISNILRNLDTFDKQIYLILYHTLLIYDDQPILDFPFLRKHPNLYSITMKHLRSSTTTKIFYLNILFYVIFQIFSVF